MEERFIFTYTLNNHDAIRAYRAFASRQYKNPYLVFSLSIIIATIGSLFPMLAEGRIPIEFLLISFAGFMVPVLFLVILPAGFRTKFSREVKLQAEHNLEMNENKISLKTIFSDSEYNWETFGDVYDTGDHFLFQYALNKGMFLFFPKRMIASPQEESTVRKFLETKIRPIKNIKSINIPEFSARNSWIFTFVIMVVFILIALKFTYGII